MRQSRARFIAALLVAITGAAAIITGTAAIAGQQNPIAVEFTAAQASAGLAAAYKANCSVCHLDSLAGPGCGTAFGRTGIHEPMGDAEPCVSWCPLIDPRCRQEGPAHFPRKNS